MSNALAIRHTAEDSQARENAASNAQVKRYWPGRAPDWYDKDNAGEAESESGEDEKEPDLEEEPAATSIAAPVVLKKVADPRLARLEAAKEEDAVAAPRIISRRQARDDSEDESEEGGALSSEESEEEDEEVTARRLAVRERLKQKKAEEEELLAPLGSDEEEEEEEESDYETDSEDEQLGRQMLKPIFVPKKDRDTIAEREALEREEVAAMKREKAKLAERAQQTKVMVVEQLKVEEAERKARKEGPKELGDIDTDDEKDPEAEYEAWRLRELQRIRRDREERDTLKDAEEEREKLRNMTAEERAAYERDNPKIVFKAAKKSWKFMQKYWHKGAFFQDMSDNLRSADKRPDDIYLRDYSAPTGEDKLNKEILPKVMQVKNFGRRGRTKYTHLVDQDTTARDEYHMQEGLHRPANRRVAGTEQVFSKPKKFNT